LPQSHQVPPKTISIMPLIDPLLRIVNLLGCR
jgi:hypothetical protein